MAQAIEDAQGRRRYVHSLPKGFADIAVVVPPDGKHVYVECKALRGAAPGPGVVAEADARAGVAV